MQLKSRPHVTIRFTTSLDGYLDDDSEKRLLLSNEADFDLVDQLRSTCDAVLVGANTIRKDNPALKIKNTQYQEEFLQRTGKMQLTRITCTDSCEINTDAKFFNDNSSTKLVFCPIEKSGRCQEKLGAMAEVIGLPSEHFFQALLSETLSRGVSRLLVEGGARVITQFLKQGLFDDLIISVAPLLLGARGKPFFIENSSVKEPIRNLKLVSVKNIDGVLLTHYINNL